MILHGIDRKLAEDFNRDERAARLEAAMRKAIEIIDANLYHQREKVEDAAAILREALS